MESPGKVLATVTFGKNGSVRKMQPYGFDLSEPTISWTQEEAAGFVLMIEALPPDQVVRLDIDAKPFIQAGRVDRQQLFVFINGLYVGFRTLAVAERVQFALQRSVLSPRGMRIEFVLPTASAPKSLGTGSDVRKLGIAISEVALSSRAPATG